MATCILCGGNRTEVLIVKGADYEYGIDFISDVMRCIQCGLVWQYPIPKVEKLKEYYPADYANYSIPSNRLIRFLLSIIEKLHAIKIQSLIGKKGKILDVGCAEGHTLEFLKKYGEWDMEGVEINLEAAQKAKAKGFKVYNEPFEEAVIPNEQFDLVRMNHLIEHVTDPILMIKKTYKILKPQGFLLIETPNIDCLDFKIFKRYWGALQLPRHIYFFNKKTLTQMLIENKFEVVHVSFSLLTTGWALSIQNFIQSRKRYPLFKGRIKGYVFLLFIFIPVVFFQKLLNRSTMMNIVARKSL